MKVQGLFKKYFFCRVIVNYTQFLHLVPQFGEIYDFHSETFLDSNSQ